MLIITGIQQIGIGVSNVHEAWKWYRQNLGFDVPIFEEAAEAKLMTKYTGGKIHGRHAVLAYNMKGGGGFEIWQYTSRTPQPPENQPKIGDLGIFAAKIKTENIKSAYQKLKDNNVDFITDIITDPKGEKTFYIKDPYDNIFQFVKFDDWHQKDKKTNGGVGGAIIGVSNIEKDKQFFSEILKYNKIIYEQEGLFQDLEHLPGGKRNFKRLLLTRSEPPKGAFSKVFGYSQIELIQLTNEPADKIFKNRLWGDLGFIHLCYDITDMDELKKLCKQKGYDFTVDSADSFDMGEAAGRFAYVETPDGTLIEFVETHKIPVIKKINWYINLQKRNPEKPLSKIITKALSLMKVKD